MIGYSLIMPASTSVMFEKSKLDFGYRQERMLYS